MDPEDLRARSRGWAHLLASRPPSGEAKGRYRSKGDAIPFAETCINRLDDRYAKTARAAAADGFTETWLTLSQLLRTTDKDQHEAILSALDNPTVIGLHRRSRTDIRLIMEGDTELWSRRRGEVHLKEGLTRAELEDIESVTEQALRWLAAHPSEDVFSAGRLFRISPSTITRGIAARRLRPVCVKCGQVVRKGFFAG